MAPAHADLFPGCAAQVVVHSDYDPETLDNDAAILKLASPIPPGTVQLMNYFTRAGLAEGDPLTVLGWGVMDEGVRLSEELLQGVVTYAPLEYCEAAYGDRVTGSMICASSSDGQDSCQGDSGGPLLQKGDSSEQDILVGLVSWGEGCAQEGKPGVYTSMAAIQPWVEETLLDLGSL